MAASVGRELLLKKASAVIAGLRTVTMSWSGESIDITTGEDSGYRLLLAASGQEQLDLSCEGIMKEHVFRALVLSTASKMLTDITLTWPIATPGNTTEATLSGNFRISSYEEGLPYNDAITFSMKLESSDNWTYTAESA
jgi:TP901-1 family phage major tail protein